MARPHPSLTDLSPSAAAGVVFDNDAVASSREHRMFGLAWSAVERGGIAIEPEARGLLALLDLAEIASHQRQWAALSKAVDRLSEAGIRVAAIKGVAAESRWFDRRGERPSIDIDLVIEDASRFAEAVKLLHPDHPMVDTCTAAVKSGVIASLDLLVDGVPIDFHVDPLKLGLTFRGHDLWWASVETLARPDGGEVEVFDRAATLVQMLVHLGRDRFRYLGTLEEARRVADGVDWERVRSLAGTEGILEPVLVAAAVVAEEVGGEAPQPGDGWRFRLWRYLWRPETRLLGKLGELRYLRRAQWLLPLTARGRSLEALVHIARTVFPPADLVRFRHGDGPYLVALLGGRFGVIRQRRIEAIRLAKSSR
jgi:hypothetical protein